MERQRVLLLSDIHYCQENFGGISADEKARQMIRQIKEEHEKDPFAMILFLGDYSMDHWRGGTQGTWLTQNLSYTKLFVDQYCKDLPVPYYMLAGNHEQYDNDQWREITGFDRNAEFVIGEYLFILWDSFGENLNPTDHSDGTYTPPKVEEIRRIMAAHPGKKVILCSHYFFPNCSPGESALIRDSRVVCLFQGHTHDSDVITLPEEYGAKKLIQTGGWFDVAPASNWVWGVRDLYLEDNRVTSGYIVASRTLYHRGVPYTVTARYQNTVEISVE